MAGTCISCEADDDDDDDDDKDDKDEEDDEDDDDEQRIRFVSLDEKETELLDDSGAAR